MVYLWLTLTALKAIHRDRGEREEGGAAGKRAKINGCASRVGLIIRNVLGVRLPSAGRQPPEARILKRLGHHPGSFLLASE